MPGCAAASLGKIHSGISHDPGGRGGPESALSSRETKFGEKKLNNAIIICGFAIDGNVLHPWCGRERRRWDGIGWGWDGIGWVGMGWRWAGDEIGMGLRKGFGMGWDGTGIGKKTGMANIPHFAFPHHNLMRIPRDEEGLLESKTKGKTHIWGSKGSFCCIFELSVPVMSHPRAQV